MRVILALLLFSFPLAAQNPGPAITGATATAPVGSTQTGVLILSVGQPVILVQSQPLVIK